MSEDNGKEILTGQQDTKRSLKQIVYDDLLDKLLNNNLVPGEILNRRTVAHELGVSVAPVLEAMLQLETEGFLESIPRKGTQVRPIRQEDIIGMFVVREALECQAARLYCGKRILVAFDRLLPLAQQLDQESTGHPQHWIREIEFHSTLVGLAECRMLSEEYKRCIHLNMFHGINKFYPREGDRGRMSHELLLRELKTPDPDVAERVIRAHVRSGKGPLADVIP
jgi:DNA-binding GntR family transcriptional regulator